MRRLLVLTLLSLVLPAVAVAAPVPEGAKWTEATIESFDGTELHADILRPKGLPESAKVPIILSVGPYFGHSGQVGALGPIQGEPIDPVGPAEGPSHRFHDFIEGARLMERGYAFVMVDLRSFGGSAGCLDWMGPGEQGDVRAAIEWAASRSWSTGRVGMYGKSYDAVTGMAGAIQNVPGLEAVVAQEPVYDMYRYLFSEGVRFANSAGTPALYDAIAATPGPLLDSPLYNVTGLTTPDCLVTNYAAQQDPDHGSEYWKARNLIKPSRVPLFLTQGFLENNTKPDGAFEFFGGLKGPKRAWLGMWDHVRGNDRDDEGRLLMGRKGFFEETMRFFDHHVREVPLADAPTNEDPPVVVQTSDGSWRSERAWPPADTRLLKTRLAPGSYADDGNQAGTGPGAGGGMWTISPPLAHDAWYAGVPKVTLTAPVGGTRSEIVVATYDIAPDRMATLLSRNASTVPADGRVTLDLYGNDWKIPAGHRIGVLVNGSHAEWWLHPPTPETIDLRSGSVKIPFLTHKRPDTLPGTPAVRLEEWLEDAPFELPEETIKSSETASFALPGPLTDAPVATPTPTPRTPASKRLRVRIARKAKRLTVFGDAPTGVRLAIKLRRLKDGRARTVRVRRSMTSVNAFRVTFKVKRAGRYRAVVRAKVDGRVVRKKTRRVRVR